MFSEQSDQVDIINTEQDSSTIINILNKRDKRNDEIVSSDVNTIWRVTARRKVISKFSSEHSIDQKVCFLVLMVRQEFQIVQLEQSNLESAIILLLLFWMLALTSKNL